MPHLAAPLLDILQVLQLANSAGNGCGQLPLCPTHVTGFLPALDTQSAGPVPVLGKQVHTGVGEQWTIDPRIAAHDGDTFGQRLPRNYVQLVLPGATQHKVLGRTPSLHELPLCHAVLPSGNVYVCPLGAGFGRGRQAHHLDHRNREAHPFPRERSRCRQGAVALEEALDHGVLGREQGLQRQVLLGTAVLVSGHGVQDGPQACDAGCKGLRRCRRLSLRAGAGLRLQAAQGPTEHGAHNTACKWEGDRAQPGCGKDAGQLPRRYTNTRPSQACTQGERRR